MNTVRKLICILSAGMTIGTAGPAFADSFHDRDHDRNRHGAQYRDVDRHAYRGHDARGYYRDHDRGYVVVRQPYVVQRSYVIERPVYYSEPAPAANQGLGAIIGAAIGTIIDNRQ